LDGAVSTPNWQLSKTKENNLEATASRNEMSWLFVSWPVPLATKTAKMNVFDTLMQKYVDQTAAKKQVDAWKSMGYEVVFTNGCFDILHLGHLKYLAEARALGDKLVVGLNSTASIKRLKGENRPVQDEATRHAQMASLSFVDLVVEFENDTPQSLIELLTPDLLVKGGDYTPDQIVGSAWVIEHGGEVRSLSFHEGYSTTALIERM
jgi:D-glycero-beta-D-manno-heptose 1-phosphate adenylyltransferase